MSNPVTVQDIANRWRPLTVDEQGVVQARLNDAWELILSAVPSVEARLLDGSLRPGLLLAVESEMVLGVIKNPDGAIEVEKAIDDYRVRTRVAAATNGLQLTDAMIALLAPPAPDGTTEGAWSIRGRWTPQCPVSAGHTGTAWYGGRYL